jgi:hypothetical protein
MQTLPCLCSAPDGKAFYLLESNGVIHRFGLPGLAEEKRVEIGNRCSWLSVSREGLCVAVAEQQEVWLVDPDTLQVKTKIAAPGVERAVSAPGLSIAFGVGGQGPISQVVSVLDLQKLAITKQYERKDFSAPLVGFAHATVTPDGKYLFTQGGMEQLQRFRIDANGIELEESSPRIAQNGQTIVVSPDSKYVALPSGGGNGPNYTTHIYVVTDLRSPAFLVNSGAYPRAMGFDPQREWVYAQNAHKQLILFSNSGIKLKEYQLPGGGEVKQFLPLPEDGSVLVLTRSKLLRVALPPR